ncbi:cytochrome C oxidase subunit IV family protein [Planctomicrobium sp. SH668]|uniref:cytochrome C oxidase subunit IV family protein n=1 Tax=Planctomicrobium sp. SH668 TaxID=3448126 RepID=UPI003F5BA1C0
MMAHSHSDAHSHAHEHHSHTTLYVTIYIALLVLVLATVGAAYIPMGIFSFPVCMGIATLKTVLIVLYFMHVKDETPLIQVFAIIGAIWLGIFFTFLMSDYLTRKHSAAVPSYADSVRLEKESEEEHAGHSASEAEAAH